MRASWHVGVVIPARDEALTIERTVASVLAALDRATRVAGCAVVVVAHRCEDDTADRARVVLGDAGTVAATRTSTVGAARAIGVHHATRRLGAPLDRTWIASTDADTVVGPDWIERQLDLADQGVAAVAGIVALGDAEPHLAARFRRSYRAGVAGGTHEHVHGANLGVRADVLRHHGGWHPLRSGEDQDLWRRLAGTEVRHDPRLVATTSARLQGRAPEGFAADLARLAAPTRGRAVSGTALGRDDALVAS
jgi:cellulose synthase/poly-beta-1,6-N-acetylglucosamine synthase-like glycosyltransferase